MKIKVTLGIGLHNAEQEDILEIPDEELEGLTEAEIDNLCDQYLREWMNNYIDAWYEVVKE